MLAIIEAIESDEDRVFVGKLYNEYNKLIIWKIDKLVFNKSKEQDLLQDTFVHIIRNLDVIKTLEKYKIKPYIMSITKNVCMDYLRKEKKEENIEEKLEKSDIDNGNTYTFNPEKMFLDKEQRENIWRNIDKLSDRDKNIILYKYAYNMSHKKIGFELGIDEKNVNMYVKRAKEKLKKVLQEEAK